MNNIGRKLANETQLAEQEFGGVKDQYRLKFHLMPKTGWMNDPNGLCQFCGTYHVFFQYSPLDPRGGMKAWGHYTSPDFVHWKLEPAPFFPDEEFDQDGVYSGSAFLENGKMYLYYTGNVKQPGDYDYVYEGREANTVLIESNDGYVFSEKKLLMTNADYPKHYSCHIRDPKVWKEGQKYYMVQGGRTKEDKGTVLLFVSDNLYDWTFLKELTTSYEFGYMWECPDYFELGGKHILSMSPQGVDSEEYHYQNIYQSGYFTMTDALTKEPEFETFTEWDMGFDFYAPQTFEDEKGRRILIGWAGIPDADYDNEPTVEKHWQHALTMPRELVVESGRLYQRPVQELKDLRREERKIEKSMVTDKTFFELHVEKEAAARGRILIGDGKEAVLLEHADGVFTLAISDGAGRGRKSRKLKIDKVTELAIYADTSLMEVYINGGAYVFTTRFYFEETNRIIDIEGTTKNTFYELTEMEGL